jgi:hypothetical protein
MLTVLAAVLCLLVQIVATEPHLRVLHRLYSPVRGPLPWSDRGTLSFQDGQLEWTASNTFQQDLLSYREYLRGKGEVGMLYQVRLEGEGGVDERQWCISSVKAVCLPSAFCLMLSESLQCYLTKGISETLVLQLDHKGGAFCLDYFVDPIPHDGSCPNVEKPSLMNKDHSRSLNSTVFMVRPARPPS